VTDTEASLLGRAAKIASVLGRYGLRGSSATPDELRAALEELGPTFAKLGQVLSTRPDLLPPEMIAELQTLQDRVTPMTEAEVVGVMEEELGVPWEDVFESIEPEPLAAGTIAQVHRARLESGENVVVKVQRPTAEEAILRDLALLELFAEKAGNRPTLGQIVDFPTVVEHLSSSLRRELDFRDVAGGASTAMTKALEKALAPYPDVNVRTRDAWVDWRSKAIDKLLNLLYVLLALSVIVSLFGMINTLVLSVFERTRELGMLRAVGVTRRQARRLIRHESVITALIGASLGLPLGLFLAGLTTRALSNQGIGYSVPVPTLLAFAVVAVVAGILAAVMPARRAARLNVLAALQYE
jgi:ABC1 atypical kinase-like domain/FtsX-like permease family